MSLTFVLPDSSEIIIPEDTANALAIGGIDITSLTIAELVNDVMTYTLVWEQVLFSALWSGNSLDSYESFGSTNTLGLETSGNAWRWFSTAGFYGAGAWQTVSLLGEFSGNSYGSGTTGFLVSGNLIRMSASAGAGAWVTFTILDGFTGTSSSSDLGRTFTINTSGGLFKFTTTLSNGVPEWASLT